MPLKKLVWLLPILLGLWLLPVMRARAIAPVVKLEPAPTVQVVTLAPQSEASQPGSDVKTEAEPQKLEIPFIDCLLPGAAGAAVFLGLWWLTSHQHKPSNPD